MRKEQILIPLVRQVASRSRLAGATLGRLDPWGNPFTDEFLADPMVLADAMREGGPVVWHPLYQQWMVMGYDEAREVLGSPHVGTQNQLEVLLSVRPTRSCRPRPEPCSATCCCSLTRRDTLAYEASSTERSRLCRYRGSNRGWNPSSID